MYFSRGRLADLVAHVNRLIAQYYFYYLCVLPYVLYTKKAGCIPCRTLYVVLDYYRLLTLEKNQLKYEHNIEKSRIMTEEKMDTLIVYFSWSAGV